jgi:hypothetical protein
MNQNHNQLMRALPSILIGIGLFFSSSGSPVHAQDIPEDLIEDEHVREEFGVNDFTTPSIRKIFADLDTLRPLPYEKLKRPIPKNAPKERTRLALGLGGLIADGFLVIESEKLLDLEEIGRALWKHAQILGAGTRLSRHTKSLLENSALGEWDALKTELAKTQKDVEAEMVLLRDVDAAHLISLGGWLRAFEIACVASLDPYKGEKAKVLGRHDIADYFFHSIQTLDLPVREQPHIQELTVGLEEIRDMLDVPESKIFTEEEALDVIIQLCDALQHAHAKGMVHRDVKPKNIMITPAGVVKLADMGLARETSDIEAATSEKGKAFGTPYYIAPEQVRGEVDIDGRADLYAVGATLFHMLTGRVPFEAKTPSEVMRKHLKEPITPPDHINTSLSSGISEVIEVTMA